MALMYMMDHMEDAIHPTRMPCKGGKGLSITAWGGALQRQTHQDERADTGTQGTEDDNSHECDIVWEDDNEMGP